MLLKDQRVYSESFRDLPGLMEGKRVYPLSMILLVNPPDQD
jgi:hypothetical protein